MTNFATATPDRDGTYSLKLPTLGLFITAGTDDDGQPYVTINTENAPPEHRYDETTGLRGTRRPYQVTEEGSDGSYGVAAPDPVVGHRVIAKHYPQPEPVHARLAAKKHADMLNDLWPTVCGMPIISVHLNDAEVYDARDHNPALYDQDGALKTEEMKADA